jgi:hypothetical protein
VVRHVTRHPTHGDSMNRVRSRWIGAQVGWLALLLLAGVPNAGAERLPIGIYTTTDGLAHNAVNRIVRDSRGFLWFCTDEGLSRFDGYAFSNFGTDQGLPHASVNDFLETRNGEYWLATGAGLVRFNPTGRPDRRVVYAHGGMSPDAMFIVVLPGDEGWGVGSHALAVSRATMSRLGFRNQRDPRGTLRQSAARTRSTPSFATRRDPHPACASMAVDSQDAVCHPESRRGCVRTTAGRAGRPT